MMEHLVQMGVSPEVMQKMTPEVRARMLSMTKDPAILAKANARVADEAAKQNAETDGGGAVGVQGRSADGSFTKALNGDYTWLDEKENVFVDFDCPPNSTEKDIGIEHLKGGICVKVLGVPRLEGNLFQEILVEKTTMTVADGKARLKLVKRFPMRWLQVTR